MGKDNAAEFLAKLDKDPSIQQGVVAAQTRAIVEYARQLGFDFTIEELSEITDLLVKMDSGEISDEELESVAGGFAKGNVLTASLNRRLLRSSTAGVVVIVATFGTPGIGTVDGGTR